MRLPQLTLLLLAAAAPAGRVHADPAPFDLAGPTIDVTVTRGARTLPISQVPSLSGGDRLWIKAELPTTQSAKYLMVVAFLRGSTNPPPSSWFVPCQTWRRSCLREGLSVTVPPEAEQALIFLAPETSGDFETLVSVVQGRPGAFVRTAQDLNQATLDRSRLDAYVRSIRTLGQGDPTHLKAAVPLLARSLAIKVDDKCLDKVAPLQAACLMQGGETLILSDGQSSSLVDSVTTGAARDLALEASAHLGYYSPYVASVMDIARIFDSFRTAHYQYIPALATEQGQQIALTLNAAPSFHSPKSVLVVALPAVAHAESPPLREVDAKQIYCARRKSLLLPVDGAPLVFATGYAHEMILSLSGAGKSLDLPARADAEQGGFAVDTTEVDLSKLGDRLRGTLRGYWGFEPYEGPAFQLLNSPAQTWALLTDGAAPLIAGRRSTARLVGESVPCVEAISLLAADGKSLSPDWSATKPNEIELKLPLQDLLPGAVTLLVTQYGTTQPQSIALQAFGEAAHLDSFTLHAGDSSGSLAGTHLDTVSNLIFKGVAFAPETLAAQQDDGHLAMSTANPDVATLKPGDSAKAEIVLHDGRVLDLKVIVQPPRPSVKLIAKSVQGSSSPSGASIRLADQDELPQDAQLAFSVRARSPASFTRDEKIEVATADGAFSQTLSVDSGAITLETGQVALARLDPAKAFGASASGPLRFRPVIGGVFGDWQPLATLVRLPLLRDLQCPATADAACTLSGSNLFLLDSVSADSHFDHTVQVPEGFPGDTLSVPHPAAGVLYFKLRDDPAVINLAALNVEELKASPVASSGETP